MAWYQMTYECPRCTTVFEDEWDSTVDGECPRCGCRHIGYETFVVLEDDDDDDPITLADTLAEQARQWGAATTDAD